MTELEEHLEDLVSAMLLKGKVRDAEDVVERMPSPERGRARIEAWKERYRGMPHGQWQG